MWAHLFQRVSGVALALYLFMHIWVIHNVAAGRQAYDGLMEMLHRPVFRVGEALVLAAVLYHSINGLRLVLMDFGLGMRLHRVTFWIVFGICALLGIGGGIAIVFFS